jgi:hypothetical protein
MVWCVGANYIFVIHAQIIVEGKFIQLFQLLCFTASLEECPEDGGNVLSNHNTQPSRLQGTLIHNATGIGDKTFISAKRLEQP